LVDAAASGTASIHCSFTCCAVLLHERRWIIVARCGCLPLCLLLLAGISLCRCCCLCSCSSLCCGCLAGALCGRHCVAAQACAQLAEQAAHVMRAALGEVRQANQLHTQVHPQQAAH
jgi:hypothetical protein